MQLHEDARTPICADLFVQIEQLVIENHLAHTRLHLSLVEEGLVCQEPVLLRHLLRR